MKRFLLVIALGLIAIHTHKAVAQSLSAPSTAEHGKQDLNDGSLGVVMYGDTNIFSVDPETDGGNGNNPECDFYQVQCSFSEYAICNNVSCTMGFTAVMCRALNIQNGDYFTLDQLKERIDNTPTNTFDEADAVCLARHELEHGINCVPNDGPSKVCDEVAAYEEQLACLIDRLVDLPPAEQEEFDPTDNPVLRLLQFSYCLCAESDCETCKAQIEYDTMPEHTKPVIDFYCAQYSGRPRPRPTQTPGVQCDEEGSESSSDYRGPKTGTQPSGDSSVSGQSFVNGCIYIR